MEWPERFSERLHIIAHGERFDVDAFLADSPLRPDFVWRRQRKSSGVEFFLGDGRTIRLRDQEEMATKYLREHRNELRAVREFPGVEAFVLGLVYIAKLNEGVHGVALDWAPELMLAAIDIGIRPVHYITYDHPAKLEQEPYAYFGIAGAFEPEEITRRVGVPPSSTARIGEAVGRSAHIKRRSSLWTLRSRLQGSGDVNEHVRDVLDQLDANRGVFEQLSCEFGGVIEIVGFSRDYAPPIGLEPDIIGRLAQYMVRLNVDPNC